MSSHLQGNAPMLDGILKAGMAHHQRGHLKEAVACYVQLLQKVPDHFDALQLLAAAYAQIRSYQKAIALFDKALAINPNVAQVHNNRGNALKELNRFEEALASFDQAISLQSSYADAYLNRGNTLKALKRLDEALMSYDQALLLKPGYGEAFYNRGLAQQALGRFDEALADYEHAIRLMPEFVNGHMSLGFVLQALGRMPEAVDAYARAISVRPEHAVAYYNHGLALQSLGRCSEAVASYKKATELQPTYAEAYFNLGQLFYEQDKLQDALSFYSQAIAARPEYIEAHNNLGLVLQKLKRHQEALASYNQCISLDHEGDAAYVNRGILLKALNRLDEALIDYDTAININPYSVEAYYNQGIALIELKRLEDALRSFRTAFSLQPNYPLLLGMLLHTQMRLCCWDGFDSMIEDLVLRIRRGEIASQPFTLHALVDSPEIHQLTAKLFVAHSPTTVSKAGKTALPRQAKKIRLGYFSSDFGNHPVAHLTAGVFEQHDRAHFEVFAFSLHDRPLETWRQRVMHGVDQFIDVSQQSDAEVAALSRSMGIDIAIDLNGHTKHARTGIFAHRAAPIQMGYLGFLGTMGAPYFDYLLADPNLVPQDYYRFYDEKVLCLKSYQCNDSPIPIADIGLDRASFGLPEDAFVFCSFNNNYKITPNVFSCWMRILGQVPRSVLWIYVDNPIAKANLQREAQAHGIEAGRLVFAEKMPLEAHLARQRLADLFLDTAPYNAGATASNALRVGLPVLTCAGISMPSRYGASLLTSIGLPELITETQDAYEALAVELATNPDRLATLKLKLSNNLTRQPLFDLQGFTRDLESLYLRVHQDTIFH